MYQTKRTAEQKSVIRNPQSAIFNLINTLKPVFPAAVILCLLGSASPLLSEEDSHGLEPAEDMVFMPKLTGLKNKSYRNQSGQKKFLSEANKEGGIDK